MKDCIKLKFPIFNTIIYLENRKPYKGMKYISWAKLDDYPLCIFLFLPLKGVKKEEDIKLEYTPLSNINDSFYGLSLDLENL